MIARRMTAVRRVRLFVIDLLFPNRCGCCGEFIRWDALLCDRCVDSLVHIETCGVCGKAECICGTGVPYQGAVVAYAYTGCARDGILELKRGGNGNFAEVLGIRLSEKIRERQAEFMADFIVPVPTKRSTLRQRGYNQAALIAKEVSGKTGIPVREDCLRRMESGTVQHILNAAQRQENVSGYQHCGRNLKDCRILLCDDVLTTGATARRCAALLLEQGAAAVMLLAGTTTERRRAEDGHRD